ncbi:MAG: hypothetical protein QXY39_05635 [Thermofilaceae archaeon]
MKVKKSLILPADVVKSLEELSEEFDLSVSDIVEFMYRKLGGRKGLYLLIKEAVVFSTKSGSENSKKSMDDIIWDLMDKQAKSVDEIE